MDIEKMIRAARADVVIQDSDIHAVAQRTAAAFAAREGERKLSYRELLLQQLRMTQKRWWAIQAALLVVAGLLIGSAGDASYMRRGLCIIATLFVILALPELWKNVSNRCMEVEMASFFSLRRIYAARVLLFGMADLSFLAIFCGCSCTLLDMPLPVLVSDFLLPLTVTAGICFFSLGSQRMSIGGIVGICAGWCAGWWLIAMNDTVYSMVALPLWVSAFCVACIFLFYSMHRLLATCNTFWEMRNNGIVFE